MADPAATDAVVKALGYAGGGTTLVLLGAFVRGILSGNVQQEKDLRDGLAERVSKLELKVEQLETKLDTTTRERDQMRYQRDRARIERDSARSRISGYEVRLAEPVTVWPPDTDGGTP